jgi:hypothetical protein
MEGTKTFSSKENAVAASRGVGGAIGLSRYGAIDLARARTAASGPTQRPPRSIFRLRLCGHFFFFFLPGRAYIGRVVLYIQQNRNLMQTMDIN